MIVVEKVLILAERVRKKDAPGKFYKSTTEIGLSLEKIKSTLSRGKQKTINFTTGYLTKTLIKSFEKDFKDKNFILLISNFVYNFKNMFFEKSLLSKKISVSKFTLIKNLLEKIKSKKSKNIFG